MASKRLTHSAKLRALTKRGIEIDPTNKQQVSRQYRALKGVPLKLERSATKKQRDELKQHGFRTTTRGVIVDGPRNKRREPLPGAKFRILQGGIVKTEYKQRRDFIVGFTKKEKREFAKDPELFIHKKMWELRQKIPTIAKSSKPQIRLQWGAYQAQKDFAPSYFTKHYFAAISPEELRREGKRNAKPRADKLTGLHIVIHIRRTRKSKHGKTKRRK